VSPALLADALLVLHAAVVLFVVGGQVLVLVGGLLGWCWVRSLLFRAAHLSVLLFVIAQSWLGRRCPLTDWEMALRREAGESAYGESFVAHWVGRLLYYQAPPWAFTLAYSAFGLLVLISWYWFPPRRPGSPGARGEGAG
jgi:hypothetical protein